MRVGRSSPGTPAALAALGAGLADDPARPACRHGGPGRRRQLDLGATAKALAADHAAAAAHRAAGGGVLVGLGGDFASAGPAPPGGWRIRVTDDHRSGVQAPGQWITVASGSLATSSTAVRRWRSVGDGPSPARPGQRSTRRAGWRTVSVAAATCLDANVASTAAIVRGEPALDWLRSLRLPSRLVSDHGTVVHVAGWPEDGDDLQAGETTRDPRR